MPHDTAAARPSAASDTDNIEPLLCRSCATALQGPYCHACGMKATSLPLTLSGMWQDFRERTLQVEKNLKRTLGHLCWQPGLVFKTVLGGQRLRYTSPLPFVLAIATLSVLLSQFYGEAYFEGYRLQLLHEVKNSLSPARGALYAQFNVWLSVAMPYWMPVFTLPVAGLMRLAFPKRGFTVAEAWAVGLYGIAMALLAEMLVGGLGHWADLPIQPLQTSAMAVLLLVTIGYYLAWLGFKPWTLIRVVAVCLLGFVLMNQLQELVIFWLVAWLPGVS